ncbi:MAG: 23S rRNA (pseudouridine(1915)-N(3))-methyltransferase RlmH [Gammaproteobacteria bacterium]|nr:23S rRNA (pseudouridine(1915)-N(3))-methyltransferase RlmH [Gammaproteobacteria bacterium]
MKIRLLCVGTKMPAWVQAGVAEYEKRCARYLGLSLVEVPMAKRSKTVSIEQCIQKESDELLTRVQADDFVVAMEVTGKVLATETLAERVAQFRAEGRNLSLLIGGPDGLGAACRERANECWSLSAMTLPHPLVRILLVEQFYRVASILQGHPYHRD